MKVCDICKERNSTQGPIFQLQIEIKIDGRDNARYLLDVCSLCKTKRLEDLHRMNIINEKITN